MFVIVIVCNTSVVFLRHSVHLGREGQSSRRPPVFTIAMSLFDRVHTTAYSPLIQTVSVLYHFRHNSEPFAKNRLHLGPRLGWPRLNFIHISGVRKAVSSRDYRVALFLLSYIYRFSRNRLVTTDIRITTANTALVYRCAGNNIAVISQRWLRDVPYECPESFWDSLMTPTDTFPKLFWCALVLINSVIECA